MTGRQSPRGLSMSPASTHGSYAPHDFSLPPLPPGSILKPSEISEPPVHEFKAIENAFLFFVTAAAIVGGVLLLFVEF